MMRRAGSRLAWMTGALERHLRTHKYIESKDTLGYGTLPAPL